MDPRLELFTKALGLAEPWRVVGVDFDEAERRLELRIDFPAGARFPCPETGAPSPVHDTAERSWRHLDFFQHQAFLIARVPRVRCPGGSVRTVELPWARPGSGFTLLFEALVMTLAAEMPVRAMAATDEADWSAPKRPDRRNRSNALRRASQPAPAPPRGYL